MKYIVSKEVHGFRYKDKRYLAGEVVELDPGDFAPPFLDPVVEETKPHPKVAPAPEPKSRAPPIAEPPKARIAASVEELGIDPNSKKKAKADA